MKKAFRILVIHPDHEYSRACKEGLNHAGMEVECADSDEDGFLRNKDFSAHLVLTQAMTAEYNVSETIEMVSAMLDSRVGQGETQIRAMLDESQKLALMGSWTVNLETKKIHWSDGLYFLGGMQPREVEPSYELAIDQIHPDYRQQYAAVIQKSIQTLQPFAIEVLGLKKNGETFWATASGRVTVNAEGSPIRLDGIVQDISERKANEQRLQEEMNFSASLLDNLPAIFVLFNSDGAITRWNRYLLEHTDYSSEEVTNSHVPDFFPPEDQPIIHEKMKELFDKGSVEIGADILTKDRRRIPFLFTAIGYDTKNGPMAIAIGYDRSQQIKTEQAMERQLTELLILQEIAALSLALNDEDELIARATYLLSKNIYVDHFGMVVRDDNAGIYRVHSSYTGLRPDAVRLEFTPEKGIVGRCIAEKRKLRIDDVFLDSDYISGSQTDMRSELCVPMIFGDEVIGVINAESRETSAYSEDDERLITTAATLLGVAIQKIRLYKMERQRWQEAEVQHEVSRALTMSLELDDVLENLLIGLQKVIPYDSSAVFMHEKDKLRIVWGRGFPANSNAIGLVVSAEDVLFQEIREKKTALIMDDASCDLRFHNYDELNPVRSWMGVPLIDQGEVFGYFTLDKAIPGFFTQEQTALASTFANHAASAIMKARLFSQTRQRLSQLQALHDIDQMITTSFDLRLTMGGFLDQVCSQLGVDAADVLKFNITSHELDFVVSRGFHTNALQHTHLKLNHGYAGKAALERQMIHVEDLRDQANEFSRSYTFDDEDFHTYYGVPLITKGEVKGVLEVFHRSHLPVDADWLDFLHILSTQAAIAIENLDLFENLQTSNLELTLAYDATLEGWARTLEMRDQETEGHSVRVTEMTIQLARAMGISAEEMIHIRRGAMLHDIGKMGIPDAILQKPGALNEAEWEIMRTHPVLAYKALSQIPFLTPAMEIPYHHHEKWDGSGYPQGIRGEDIPFAARIFAIIDVYDALSSERPYRPPWPQERVIPYIRQQSGRHFDPAVVEAFCSLIQKYPLFGKE